MTTPKEPQERKADLLNVAEALFMEKGYEAATVNDIISREGVAKGTFYHYFKSKEDILTALIGRFWDQFEVEARTIMNEGTLTTMEKVERVIGTTISLKKSKMYLVPIVHQGQNALLLEKLRREGQERFTPLLAVLVEHGVREGIFDTPYPKQATAFLIQIIGDPTFAMVSYDGAMTADEWLEALGDIIERVLGAPRGSFQTLIKKGEQQMSEHLSMCSIPFKDG